MGYRAMITVHTQFNGGPLDGRDVIYPRVGADEYDDMAESFRLNDHSEGQYVLADTRIQYDPHSLVDYLYEWEGIHDET
jgi:hypothetical protein